jgi:PAS domain S-box-containing protein
MTTKDDEDMLLRSVALQNANSILIARQRAEQRSEAYLAEAQRLSHTGSFGWRVSTGEIVWSEETFRIFQYDRTMKPTVELMLQRVHPEDAALVKQTVEHASQDGKDFDFEHRLLMPDGSVKYVHVVAHAERDESGSIEFVGAVMDVTEQHQARAALEKAFDEIKKSQDRLRLVIDTIPSMVWSALPDGSVDFVSQPWMEYHGLSLEDLDRQGLAAFVHPDDVAESTDNWSAALAAGKQTEHELRARRADGAYRWFLMRAVPLRDELGDIVKWYGTITDIEDRKRAETLLAGEKRLLEMIGRGDSRALILDALCRHFEELASGSLSSILLFDPNASCLRHGAAPSLPLTYTEAIDGLVIGPSVGSCGTAAYRAQPVIVSDIATDPLWADYRDLALAHGLRACWSSPILSSEGRMLGTFATYYHEPRSPTPQEQNVIEQITHLASIAVERDQAERALEDLAGRLIHAQEEERRRIGRELHDHVSQMLGVLTIKIDQLRANGAITPGVGGALDELRRDTGDITDDVHRLSHRLHSSTLDYLGLVPALQKLVSEFSERHDISIAFTEASMPPSLPSEVSLCLFRVAEESLTNIAKHSQARSATIQVTSAPDGIRLRVEDAGTGFDKRSSRSKAGLGFVSMQERLRVLRGTVRVDSAPSQGTRIDVWVPSSLLIPEAEQDGTSTEQSPPSVSSG